MVRAGLIGIVLAFSSAAQAQDAASVIRLAETIGPEAQRRAERLARAPGAAAEAPASDDAFVIALQDFALETHRLSRTLESRGGPIDLRCIFRGMSEDAENRATLLSEPQTRADQARVYLEIVRLAGQAAQIAASPDAEAASRIPPSCSAG